MAGKENPRRKNGARRDHVRAYWRARELPCAICGKPIDYTLHHLDDGAFEVDEIDGVWEGGDPFSIANTQPSHRKCNREKYQAERRAAKAKAEAARCTFRPLKTSGEW